MPQVKNVEKKIRAIEEFNIIIRSSFGADIRGDKQGVPQYPYERMAKDDMTVAEWKNGRFYKCYPGYDVDVLDGNGESVNGNTKLSTVRDTYRY